MTDEGVPFEPVIGVGTPVFCCIERYVLEKGMLADKRAILPLIARDFHPFCLLLGIVVLPFRS